MDVVVARNARRYFLFSLTMTLVAVFLATPSAGAAEDKAEYEFANVENLPFQKGLPDPFLMPDGKRVQTFQDWRKQREYHKAMLAHYLYGHMPPRPKKIEIKQVGSESIYNGKGVEERYTLTIRRKGKSVTCRFLIVRPSLKKRYPTIIKNDRVSFDASPERSDLSQSFYPGSEAVKRGYLLCRFHRTDLASDVQEEGRKAGDRGQKRHREKISRRCGNRETPGGAFP